MQVVLSSGKKTELKNSYWFQLKTFPLFGFYPKGHIKRSETEQEAAIREVKEEAGMKVTIVSKIGNSERLQWNFKKQIVAFYLMRFETVHHPNEENRRIRWLALEDAIRKLFYLDQKKIIRKLQLL